MTSVRKSPNMMSTTGRSPVIAAPTPSPVVPAAEIGESRIRSGPNSSTSPDRTLNGVPASAMSSPIRKTRSSRRSSSASASLTACASVSSRVKTGACTLDEDILGHLARFGERCGERELHTPLDLVAGLLVDRPQRLLVGEVLLEQPGRMQRDRVAFRAPQLFLVLGSVVPAVDVADVVAVVAVRVAEQERRAATTTRAGDECGGRVEN